MLLVQEDRLEDGAETHTALTQKRPPQLPPISQGQTCLMFLPKTDWLGSVIGHRPRTEDSNAIMGSIKWLRVYRGR